MVLDVRDIAGKVAFFPTQTYLALQHPPIKLSPIATRYRAFERIMVNLLAIVRIKINMHR